MNLLKSYALLSIYILRIKSIDYSFTSQTVEIISMLQSQIVHFTDKVCSYYFITRTSYFHLFPFLLFFRGKGGCDEEISIFLYRGRVEKEIVTQLQGKETGLREHGELIKVRVVPYKKLWRTTADAKVLVAVALFEMATKEGLLPPLAT